MGVLHDYKCKKHGEFEASHPICPAMGCASEHVDIVFKKAPGLIGARTKNFDRGMKDTATQMGLLDFRSTKGEESSFAHSQAGGMLWGNQAASYFGGVEQMAQAATAPLVVNGKVMDTPNGMRMAAKTGIMDRVLPPAQRIYAAGDPIPGAKP